MSALRLAPPWTVAGWLGDGAPPSLEALRGQVVMLLAFQVRCDGCVRYAVPQAQRVATAFADAPLAVVGLHAVFEHHAAMDEAALREFVWAQGLTFPIAIDAPSSEPHGLPVTMAAYAMQGTPTVVLIDRRGRLRRQALGPLDDLRLGADLGALLAEA